MKRFIYGIFVVVLAALSGPQWGVYVSPVALSAEAGDRPAAPVVAKRSSVPDLPASRKPPEPLQAIYLTQWSAAASKRVETLIGLARSGRVNAVVLDIKDASGFVAFDTAVPDVKRYGARHVTIRNIDSLVQRLHGEGLYVIARIVVFEDPRLAEARPDLAVHRQSKLDSQGQGLSLSTLWMDRRGLAWIDPASREAWDYNIAIAKDAVRRGFDEINFDYIRFPSDGNLQDMHFPCWDGTRPRNEVIGEFFAYLRRNLLQVKISADLFGLATVKNDDLGIGQIIEDAYRHFDYVCPMVYPSHFAVGFLGERNPAKTPFRVVHYSMKSAHQRLQALPGKIQDRVKLRPWLQDFDLGADYDADMVRAQIEAVCQALGEQYIGFMLWNPLNRYTAEALPRVVG